MNGFKFWIEKKEEKSGYGRFILSPLPRGFGHTFGNSLRRVLLGYMPGAAITQIKVKGANHQFAVLKGVKEDLIDIIMDIKQIKIKYEKDKPVKLLLEKKGAGVVKASDIKTPVGVEITNPNLVIANLADRGSELKIEFMVERGVGYSLAEGHMSDKMRWIAIDAIFSPITKVNYVVKDIRVGRKEGMNELTLEIWTDKTVSPFLALKQAADTLTKGLSLIAKPIKKKVVPAKKEKSSDNLSLYLEEIDLPLRLINALKRGGFKKLVDFKGLGRADLLKVKNVGDKSCDQLIRVLKAKGVNIKT